MSLPVTKPESKSALKSFAIPQEIKMSEKLQSIKEDASSKIEELAKPESIRTPGRTWTTYPELETAPEEINPEIKTEGEVEVYTGEKAEEHLFEIFDLFEDKISAFHAANINSLIFVEATGKAEVKINYNDEKDTFAHLIVKTRQGAELSLTEEFRNTGLATSFNEFHVGENSNLTYGALEAGETEFNYARRKAILDNYSKINWLNAQFRGEFRRTKIETVLKGDNSEVDKLATWYPTEKQHNDISMQVFHEGENTRCDMDSRGVVDDKARSVYEGLQKVEEVAEETSSFQHEDVLILSDKAEVDASPKLMIENPDVEASHAASTGSIDKKKNHYIETRGLTEEQARKLIVRGWFEPVLQEIELPELKEKIRDEVRRKLE